MFSMDLLLDFYIFWYSGNSDSYTRFFYKQQFYKHHQAEIDKKLSKTAEAELLLFGKYLHLLSMLSSKNNRKYSKKCLKKTSAPFFVRLYD